MAQAAFLDKTLLAIARLAEQSMFSEQYAGRRGLLQSLDIRFQLLTFLFILVVISLLHQPWSLWRVYGAGLALAAWSRVPLWFFLKRVWLFVPLFHIFGSEELSSLSSAIKELSPGPYLALNGDDAQKLGFADGDVANFGLNGRDYRLQVKIRPALPMGVAGLPFGIPPLEGMSLPSWGSISKGEAGG